MANGGWQIVDGGCMAFVVRPALSVLCRLSSVACFALASLCLAQAASADDAADYPSRVVRIIVSPLPAGSPDIVARLMADRLAPRWGHAVVVENRPGAAGNLGAAEVAAAAPNGYTLLSSQPAPLTTNVLLYGKLRFDPAAFDPVILMSTLPNTPGVTREFPANSVPD